jgi:hypothetical protein
MNELLRIANEIDDKLANGMVDMCDKCRLAPMGCPHCGGALMFNASPDSGTSSGTYFFQHTDECPIQRLLEMAGADDDANPMQAAILSATRDYTEGQKPRVTPPPESKT